MSCVPFVPSAMSREAMRNIRARMPAEEWDRLSLREILALFQDEMYRLYSSTAIHGELSQLTPVGWLH